jgi:hypothetical protein
MRKIIPIKLVEGRVREGYFASDDTYGLTGAFEVVGPMSRKLRLIASDGEGWEHVSISIDNRPPNWAEMCFAKDLFWNDDECVIQYHPPRSQYVNCHPFTLHLWKPIGIELPMPPTYLIGPTIS